MHKLTHLIPHRFIYIEIHSDPVNKKVIFYKKILSKLYHKIINTLFIGNYRSEFELTSDLNVTSTN